MATFGGSPNVTGSIFSGNSSGRGGGSIYNNGGTLAVTNSTMSGNYTYSTGPGGGIYNNAGTLTVTNSTMSGNSADNGGGIFNGGTVTMTNSTLSGNSASLSGGGIFNAGSATLNYANTIIANSTGGDCVNSGIIVTNTENLVKDGSCSPSLTGDPLLSALGNYGGPTQTFALLPGSRAIDAGNATICAGLPGGNLDQRGITRPQGSACDIGAFESRGFTLTKTGGDNQSALINTDFSNLLTLMVSSAFGEPVDAGQVTFTPPAAGASAAITSSPMLITSGAGTVDVIATANGTAGGPYNVVASATGAASVNFSLTNMLSTTTSVSPSPNPSTYGQSVTFTATVSASSGTPVGTVTFSDGGSPIGTASLSGGVATLTISTLSVGSHTITADYPGDTTFMASASSTVSQTINQATTTTAITSDAPDPSVVGQAVTFNYTVSAVAPGAGTPTGNVLVSNGTASCTGTVAAGTCSITLTAPGTSNFTATYAGDTNFLASASAVESHTVNQASTTTMITSDAPDPSVVGQAVTFNYTVSAVAPGAGTPTGNVLVSNGTASCTGTVAAGTCSITLTAAGTSNFTAAYAGDTNFLASASAVESHGVCISAITVTDADDSGAGTLRQAIADICPGGTIDFNLAYPATITLLTGELLINKDMTINGPGASSLTLSGNNASRVFNISAGTASISGVTVSNGYGDPSGGGIYNRGTLTVTNCTISANKAGSSSNVSGGGIYNDGTLTVTNCTISANKASVTDGSLGGGIYNGVNGMLTITNSTISGNSASASIGVGGGINNDGNLTITNSTISGNSAMGFAGWGGGIHNNGYLTIMNSTISGNSAIGIAGEGGGIANWRLLAVTNSTISGNTADESGGGIYIFWGTATLTNSTLSGNSCTLGGCGIENNSSGTLNYANTIIANSTGGADCVNPGTIGTNTNNLVEDNSCSPAISGDPLLGPLQDNGGPTQTMALLAGSPAINAGDDTVCAAAPVNGVDQRGIARPQGSACDIGAYEFVSTTTTTVTSSANPSVFGESVTFTADVTGTESEPPTGTVTFKDGATTLGTGTLSGGTATFSTSALTVGSHLITAEYSGDTNFAASISSALSQKVNQAHTTATYSLNVTKAGNGTVTGVGINCGGLCSSYYGAGTVVTLTATPSTGSTFSGWAGACSGTSTSCTVTMNGTKSVTATFSPANAIPQIHATYASAYNGPATPVLDTEPDGALPIGLGSAAEGGDTLTLQIGLNPFSEPVDLYLLLYAPAIDPNNIYQLGADGALHKVSDGMVPWKQGVTNAVHEDPLGDISISLLPPGTYDFYLMAAPSGTTASYLLWETTLVVPSPSTLPLPSGGSSFTSAPLVFPVMSSDPSKAGPISLGEFALNGELLGVSGTPSAGDNLNISIGLEAFSGPVDLYVGIYAPGIDPASIYLLNQDGALQRFSGELVPWKQDVTEAVNESLFGDIPVSSFPSGIYTIYLAITPAGPTDNYYLWTSTFTIP